MSSNQVIEGQNLALIRGWMPTQLTSEDASLPCLDSNSANCQPRLHSSS